MRSGIGLSLVCCALGAADWRMSVSSSFRDLRNPYEHDRSATSAGKKLYRDYCADCHSRRGAGTRFGPPLRSKNVAAAKPGEVFWLLRTGVADRKMPSFSFLSDRELWTLVSFVRQLR